MTYQENIPRSHDQKEKSPLPEEPAAVAEFLTELWKDRRRNEVLRKEWSDMDEDEKEEFRKEYFQKKETEPDFQWLADIYGSEMGWSQNSIDTNYGKVFWFKFGYVEERSEKELSPDVFVIYPENHDYTNGFIVTETNQGWKKQPLDEFAQDHQKRMSELLGEEY